MATKNKLLTVLSDAEKFALYGLPDFDEGQRLEYLSLSEAQLALACSRTGLHAQVYCVLQIGYFKAKHAFFRFTLDEVQADCAFVLARYFSDRAFEPQAITKHEHYTQRAMIAGYEASGNTKALAMIKKTSPAAWRHVHLSGHYTFRGTGPLPLIDLDAIVAGLDLG